MEEQEKIDMREHIIGWIDTFLKDGIIPSVVNPKAIKANYILKSKIRDKIEELEEYQKQVESKVKEKYSERDTLLQVIGGIYYLKELLEEVK